MNLKKLLGSVIVAVLFFIGIVFALASVYAPTRLIVSILLFALGFGIIYYLTKKPKRMIQTLEMSGEMKAIGLTCPNCSGSISTDHIRIVSGVPYATCPYCGKTFQIIEEPKW